MNEVTDPNNKDLLPQDLLELVHSHMKWNIEAMLRDSAIEDKVLPQIPIYSTKGEYLGVVPNGLAEPQQALPGEEGRAVKRERSPTGYNLQRGVDRHNNNRDFQQDDKKRRVKTPEMKRKDLCLSNLAYVLKSVGARECSKGSQCPNDHNVKVPPRGRMLDPIVKIEALRILESRYPGNDKIAFKDNLVVALNKRF